MDFSSTQGPSPSSYAPDINDIIANETSLSHDPFMFSHGLSGVNQTSNYLFVNILVATALVPAMLAFCFRIFISVRNDRRRISAIASCRRHDFWKRDRYTCWGPLKRYFLYAPVTSSRQQHQTKDPRCTNRTTNLTIPQITVIVVYVLSNLAYCLAIPVRPRVQMVAELRGRCGALAAFNLIFTVLFALRNNPLIRILRISYDTFNLFHRWTARLVVFESIAHVSAFLYNTYQVTYSGQSGWHSISWLLGRSISYQSGLVAFVAFGLLMIHSIRPLRHAFYETFLTLHRIGIAVSISGVYFHLAKHALPQLPWIYLVITLLVLELLIRTLRLVFYNLSWRQRSWTRVNLAVLPGEATRVTFELPRSWNANPGSHVQIYIPRVAPFASHPFSVAWSQPSDQFEVCKEKLPSTIDDLKLEQGPSTVSCIIRSRRGFTKSLYNLASKSEGDQAQLWGAIEGPYGGFHTLDTHGTVLLFAAGVGITHQLSFVRHLLSGHNTDTAATRKVLLVWCIANIEALEWVQPWLEEIEAMQNFRRVVRIRLHISRMTSFELQNHSLPAYLDIKLERCNVRETLDDEILAQVGAMGVSVCGPSRFSASVRAAVRRRVGVRSIDFFEEAFSY
jgi:predicted ferric reductase